MAFQRASTAFAIAALCLGLGVSPAASQGMMRRDARDARVGKSALQTAIEKVLRGEAAERLLAVEASVRPTYEAFPKNSMGRIPPSEIFPAIVRGYFAKEHGWLVMGLAPPNLTPKRSEVHEALILRERAPAVADALKELRESDRGLSLSDVVGTIAAIEHLLVDESEAILQGAYLLNELSIEDPLESEAALSEVLHSFLLLVRHGHPYNLADIAQHRRMKARAQRVATEWQHLEEFAAQAIRNSGQSGPYTFASVASMARELNLGYGKWQNGECMQMKTTLMDLAAQDASTDNSGTLKFEHFHGEPKHPSYQFTESLDYLRKYGILEEPEGREPLVRIANYLLAPSNCIASSKHYAICCLNECEALTSDLEQSVQAPVWPAERLFHLVNQTASSSRPVPREVPAVLGQELQSIAAAHEGAVPLHSAEFRQWLHSAFPNECPLPTASEEAAEEWERQAAESWLATQQECTRIPQWHPIAHGEAIVNV
mmetsp:Transcript_59154/g.175972  ORF Transcript_59154/g.175972 Transcript_59154/m.175972 type:complete len:487 (+) Transcript_59154:73-1533(+)